MEKRTRARRDREKILLNLHKSKICNFHNGGMSAQARNVIRPIAKSQHPRARLGTAYFNIISLKKRGLKTLSST
jgi:hypothetical protein